MYPDIFCAELYPDIFCAETYPDIFYAEMNPGIYCAELYPVVFCIRTVFKSDDKAEDQCQTSFSRAVNYDRRCTVPVCTQLTVATQPSVTQSGPAFNENLKNCLFVDPRLLTDGQREGGTSSPGKGSFLIPETTADSVPNNRTE